VKKLSVALLIVILLTACQPQIVKETVIIEKEVTRVIRETVVVEKKVTVEVEKKVTVEVTPSPVIFLDRLWTDSRRFTVENPSFMALVWKGHRYRLENISSLYLREGKWEPLEGRVLLSPDGEQITIKNDLVRIGGNNVAGNGIYLQGPPPYALTQDGKTILVFKTSGDKIYVAVRTYIP